jgi:fructan beta-fructosidase
MAPRFVFNVLMVVLTFFGMVSSSKAQRTEHYRSQYHFSPNNGWIGDPDSLVHYNGYYHLFWPGHAVSQDLVHWTELPYPIMGDPGIYQVNTGGAVIDKANVSGLGTNSFINFHSLAANNDQRIGISSSTDSANTFTSFNLYTGNPILSPNPAPAADFRDPTVFWDQQSSSWIMLLTLGASHQIQFFRSTDLLHWGAPISTFGPDGDTSNTWETPDLFALPVDGNTGNMKYVLTVGVSPNRMRYFVGTFDGTKFTNLYPGQVLSVDSGLDFYAARTWREYDGAQTATPLLGWMGNWQYSTNAPSQLTYGGEGVMSVPRNLALTTYAEGIRLVQTPIPALQGIRQTAVTAQNVTVSGTHPITDFAAFQPSQNSYEIDATFTVTSAATFGFNLLVDSGHTHELVVQYNPSNSTLTVDRTTASDATLNSYFTVATAPVPVQTVNGQLRLHMFVDESSIEIFTNDGKVVMTLLTYPGTNQLGIEVFANGGSTTLANFSAWPLASIWNGSPTNAIQPGSIYEIQARHDGKVMDANGSIDETPLQQWDWLGGANQKWKVNLVAAGYWQSFGNWVPPYYSFTSQGNGKVMDLRDGSTSNGAVVQQYDWENNDNQKWQIEGIGGGFYKIISKATSTNGGNESVEVQCNPPDNGLVNGDPLQTWEFFAYTHQEWQFILTQ